MVVPRKVKRIRSFILSALCLIKVLTRARFALQSDQFQDDLYPDTVAPVSALSAADWFNGMNKPPVLMSMKTGLYF